MVSINIEIKKKDLWMIAAMFVFIAGLSIIIAYNPSYLTTPGTPSVAGHTPDEILVNLDGTEKRLQTAIDDGNIGFYSEQGSVVHGGTIAEPTGFLRADCTLLVTMKDFGRGGAQQQLGGYKISWDANWLVTCQSRDPNGVGGLDNENCYYLLICHY